MFCQFTGYLCTVMSTIFIQIVEVSPRSSQIFPVDPLPAEEDLPVSLPDGAQHPAGIAHRHHAFRDYCSSYFRSRGLMGWMAVARVTFGPSIV